MMHSSLRLLPAALLLALASASSASALVITPSSVAVTQGNETSESVIQGLIATAIGTVPQIYKATPNAGDVGAFAGSYETDFSNPSPLVPSSALISYVGGPVIASTSSRPAYAFIRDGNYENYNWYLFAIPTWNGTEELSFSGFFPLDNGDSKNISHVAIYGSERPRTPSNTPGVPDGGSTAVLLGSVMLGLIAFARRWMA